MSLRSWLGLKPKPIVPDAPTALEEPRLGLRSPFVRAKIGNDLRSCYDDVIEEPMPKEIQAALARLPDAPEVLPFPTNPKAAV